MAKFSEGNVYFRVVYPDPGLLYPNIQSFIYIGMNFSDEDDVDTWYFQFADDYAKYGSFLESEYSGHRVCCLVYSELSSMFDSTELKKQLDLAEVRRSE